MIKVISLFDGISCGRVALDRLGIPVSEYHAYEVDVNATIVSDWNYPEIIRQGSVLDVNWREHRGADLLIGGSPCQDLSSAGKGAGLEGSRSSLFWEYVEALIDIKPRYFLFENVASMKKADQDIISMSLCCEPIEINSALVSAQNRRRLYWTNIPNVAQPLDRGISVQNILEYSTPETRDKRLEVRNDFKSNAVLTNEPALIYEPFISDDTPLYKGTPNSAEWHAWFDKNKEYQLKKGYSLVMNEKAKAMCLTARSVANWNGNLVELFPGAFRYLTVTEAERLQGLPDHYCTAVSKSAAYKAIGNGWQVDTIMHILSYATW